MSVVLNTFWCLANPLSMKKTLFLPWVIFGLRCRLVEETLQPLADLLQRPRLDDRASCPLYFARSFGKSVSVRTRFSARTQRL